LFRKAIYAVHDGLRRFYYSGCVQKALHPEPPCPDDLWAEFLKNKLCVRTLDRIATPTEHCTGSRSEPQPGWPRTQSQGPLLYPLGSEGDGKSRRSIPGTRTYN